MKIVDFLGRIVAFFLLVSFVSCSSTPYAVVSPQVNFPQLQLLQATGGTQKPSTQATKSQTTQTQTAPQASSPYWTGDGGRGKSITILPPDGKGLAENQMYLPGIVASELISNFTNYSAIIPFDPINNDRQYKELMSGRYDDNDKALQDLGHLASTDYMLTGTITKTSTGYVLQLTVNKNSDKMTVASYSETVAIADMDNLTGVRKASLDLLQKMGVQITTKTRTELTKAATTDQVNARTFTAQGINAQLQGNDLAALTYFSSAAAFDASLAEAVSRTNILSANISTGNIGANIRNDFAWSDDWKAKLVETETLMNDMLRNTTPQRSLWYSDNIVEQESARDREKRTTELRIEAVLHTHAALPVSVQRTVQAVYDGLQSTKRAEAWKFNNWPRQGVTNNNPFNQRWGGAIAIAFEVLNSQGKVIGKQTVNMDSIFSYNGTQLNGPGTIFTTVRFTGVNGYDIDDHMSIRIASINGVSPEKAGISQIAPMAAQQMQTTKDFTIYNGSIRPNTNKRDLGTVTIPSELWGERVTAIADKAFENKGITSVIIPEGVISIGERAFANNHWERNGQHYGLTGITIPSTVSSIGQEAFYSYWTEYSDGRTFIHSLINEVTIGANVNLGKNAIGNGFEAFYAKSDKQAGSYSTALFVGWKRFGSKGEMAQKVASDEKSMKGAATVFSILLIGGLVTWAIIDPDFWKTDK